MACTASYDKRVGKEGLAYVKTMAQHQADIEQHNMEVVEKSMAGVGKYYDYQPAGKNKSSNGVEIVKFRRGKSKSVLRHPKDKQQKPVAEKPKKVSAGKDTK